VGERSAEHRAERRDKVVRQRVAVLLRPSGHGGDDLRARPKRARRKIEQPLDTIDAAAENRERSVGAGSGHRGEAVGDLALKHQDGASDRAALENEFHRHGF
jgi:hypothetical protein